mmetsp:Transcript_10522/g.32357  ORF Transcript_10522/g.32357 Transcript_10522/m.32357 type:complete len:281 (+) Transcript_10522:1430-2272(+)
METMTQTDDPRTILACQIRYFPVLIFSSFSSTLLTEIQISKSPTTFFARTSSMSWSQAQGHVYMVCESPTRTTYRPPTGSNTLKAETLRPDEDAALPASQKSTTLHPEFIRRYVYFARHQMEATLSENACQNIASAYADLRAKADERTLPVTARCLESLIRLATANAKVRLSEAVDERDCNAALELLSPPRRVNKTRLYTLRLQCHSFAMFGDARRSNAETTSASGSLASKLSIFRANKVPRLENSILDFNRANFISGVYTDIMNEKDDGTAGGFSLFPC